MKKLFALLLCAILLITSLIHASAETKSITWWTWSTEATTAYQKIVSDFEAQNPDIKVDLQFIANADYWTKMPVAIVSGIRNDCVYHCENNSDDTLVLFCHYAIGMATLAYLTNMPPVPMWHSFLFPTSSVTTLITQERTRGEIEFRCISAGDISHLLQGNEHCSLRGLFPEAYNGVESTDPNIWPYASPIPVIR